MKFRMNNWIVSIILMCVLCILTSVFYILILLVRFFLYSIFHFAFGFGGGGVGVAVIGPKVIPDSETLLVFNFAIVCFLVFILNFL